jgi:hypothetical protein
MGTIKEILMERDGMSEAAAEELIQAAREELWTWMERGEDNIDLASDICMEYFGLEPDYIMELL